MSAQRNDGGPAFPHPDYLYTGPDGMTLRDYAAIHSTQPGMSEMVAMAGMKWSAHKVWHPDKPDVGIQFDEWWESMPLEDRLLLAARVRYAEADAMLKARQA